MSTHLKSYADLHIHSKYSDRPSEWFLRRIGAPESFVEPLDLYHQCRARGMQYVTISDHNCIEGALQIAHLPNTFVSVESTTYFPEDGAKMHILICGINERQFEEIQGARENIYELRDYLVRNNIFHSVAHALFRVNNRLTVEHLEKLLVLFKRFEVINGARDKRANQLVDHILSNLTSEQVYSLAEKHKLDPLDERPWEKFKTAGSDDHGGLFSACAFTETPHAQDTEEFLGYLRAGNHRANGASGSSLQLASSLYQISYHYYRHYFLSDNKRDNRLMGSLFKSIIGRPQVNSPKGIFSLRGLINRFNKHRLSANERQLLDDLSSILSNQQLDQQAHSSKSDSSQMVQAQFEKICRASQHLARVGLERFLARIRSGYLIESFQALSSLGLIGVSVAPYITAFKTQHKDERFIQAVARRFGADAHAEKSGKKAWVTDTISDTNGVAHTIKILCALAQQSAKQLTLICCEKTPPLLPFEVRNFEPVGIFPLPEYEQQQVVLPPFLEMLRYFELEEFDEVIISTPGPLGIAAKLIASLLGIRTVGLYHTDFPRYAEELTEDAGLANLASRYMDWFYKDLDRILVPSRHYQEELAARGIDERKLSIMPRGVSLESFSPHFRKEAHWEKAGLNGEFKYLYVGRISREKNLETLLHAFNRLAVQQTEAALIIVGDGPELERLRSSYGNKRVLFTGRLEGRDLAEAYASCDVLVFPSLTDTFGNVVLEAHACGLPAIVGDKGGPPEIVKSHHSGLIVDDIRPQSLAAAMELIRSDRNLYDELKQGALKKAAESSWERVLDLL